MLQFFDQLLSAIWNALRTQNWQTLIADRAVQQASAMAVAVVIWNVKWVVVTPAQFLFKYLFSAKYRDLRSVGGDYYLYHGPLWVELGAANADLTQKIRVSLLKIKVGLKRNEATQIDLVRKYGEIGYAGEVIFQKEFIYIPAEGKLDRYVGNRKHITMYRQHLTAKRRKWRDVLSFRKLHPVATGTCGIMTGIANNNNIYFVPVVLSRFPLSSEVAGELLAKIRERGLQVAVAKEIRGIVERQAPRDFDGMATDFDSPFG